MLTIAAPALRRAWTAKNAGRDPTPGQIISYHCMVDGTDLPHGCGLLPLNAKIGIRTTGAVRQLEELKEVQITDAAGLGRDEVVL
ncbi:MAG: hypothetical protein ACLVJ6_07185 [Merdibacter sp.]